MSPRGLLMKFSMSRRLLLLHGSINGAVSFLNAFSLETFYLSQLRNCEATVSWILASLITNTQRN